MDQTNDERLRQFNSVICQENQGFDLQARFSLNAESMASQLQSSDKDADINQSPFRSSDPTVINRRKTISFQKTGDLLRRIKRQLSSQTLQKCPSEKSAKINDNFSTEHSHQNKKYTLFPHLSWENNQMIEATVEEYEKQILRLKVQMEDIKEQKKQIKQTLQKQRKFYMSEMYSKQLILEESQFQSERLKGQIEKYINLQYQLQQKIRLLELENSQVRNQLERCFLSSPQNSQIMEPIYEEDEDIYSQPTNARKKQNNRMFMSLDQTYLKGNFEKDQDPFEIIRLAHERQIMQYEKQIKNLRQFYQSRIRTMRKSYTPQKKQRNSINIMDEYVCGDNVSCESQSYQRPQNLRYMLRDSIPNSKSSKKVQNDCQSHFTTKYFAYPNNSKKNLHGEDIFIRESLQNQDEQLSIRDVQIPKQELEQQASPKKLFKYGELLKGLTIGTLAGGVIALAVYRKFVLNN